MKICTAQAARDLPSLCYGAVIVQPFEYEVTINGQPAGKIRIADDSGWCIGIGGKLVHDGARDCFVESVLVGNVEIRKAAHDRSEQCDYCGDGAPSDAGFPGCGENSCGDPEHVSEAAP